MGRVTPMPLEEVMPGDRVLIHGQPYMVRWISGPDKHGMFDVRVEQQGKALEAITCWGRLEVIH